MKMDDTWSVFDFAHNLEEFEKLYKPEIYLKPKVHKDVVQNFQIVKQLIRYSFFEYKFYDVATLKSLLTLEMALKIRYREVTGTEWQRRRSLARLMDWFRNENYFETYNKEYLTIIRSIRNSLAHPSEHTVSGPFGRHIIENVIDLINGLYEDPKLRRKRMSLTINILNKLKEFKNGIKCSIGNDYYFAINAWPAFINNKKQPMDIHFYFNPTIIIPDSTLEKTNLVMLPALPFVGNSVRILKNSLELKKDDSDSLFVSEITDKNEKTEFADWVSKYEKYLGPAYGYIHSNDDLKDTFTLHLRKFHKID
jgi:hypothetical protein